MPLNCDGIPIACGSYSSNPGHVPTRSVHLSSIICLDTHQELNICPLILDDINLISLQNHHQVAPLVPYFNVHPTFDPSIIPATDSPTSKPQAIARHPLVIQQFASCKTAG